MRQGPGRRGLLQPWTARAGLFRRGPLVSNEPENRRVGEHDVLQQIGRGGMGVVYKARQVRLDRIVALKMVSDPDLAGPEQLARFRTEAEAIARLRHPNIVQIYEVGEHDGLPYFSLEYVTGGSLADWLDGTPLPGRQAAQLVLPLARAIQAAHQ